MKHKYLIVTTENEIIVSSEVYNDLDIAMSKMKEYIEVCSDEEFIDETLEETMSISPNFKYTGFSYIDKYGVPTGVNLINLNEVI